MALLGNKVRAVEEKIYQAERFLVGIIFLALSSVVFVDVVHRVFSRSPGRLSVFINSFMPSFSVERIESTANPLICALVLWLVAYAGLKSRAKSLKKNISSAKAALIATIAAVVIGGLTQAFINIMPEGVVWAPYFGLVCLLWIGLLGASMAVHTNQHLLLEMGEKIWPEKMLPSIRTLANFTVAAFCLVIAILAVISSYDHFLDWQSGPGAGLVPSIEWPKWIVFSVIPYAFSMMGIRYLLISFRVFKPIQPAEIM